MRFSIGQLFRTQLLGLFLLATGIAWGQSNGSADFGVLIQRLGSPSFADRQAAFEELLTKGSAASPALKQATSHPNREIAIRASRALLIIERDLQSLPPKLIKTVLFFQDASLQEREVILRDLVREGQIQLTYELMEQVDPSQRKKLFHEVFSINDKLLDLARKDRWEEFEFILGHPITFESSPVESVYYYLACGRMNDLLNRLKAEIQSKKEDSKEITTQEVRQVLALLRLTDRYDEAESYAEMITDQADRRSAIFNLWFERGQWEKIKTVMVDPRVPVGPTDQKLVVTFFQEAFVNRITGDEAGYQKTLQKIETKAKRLESDGDKAGLEKIRIQLTCLGFACLDWSLVVKNLNPEKTESLYDVYTRLGRIEEAMRVIELPDTLAGRSRWIERKILKLRSLQSKIARLAERKERTNDARRELEQTWNTCFDVVDQIGQLGFVDEATLHYLNLFGSMGSRDSVYRRAKIVSGLVDLGRVNEVWDLVDRGFSPPEQLRLINSLFPKKLVEARFWFNELEPRYPTSGQRLRAVSGMLNSNLGTLANFDFELETPLAVTKRDSGELDFQLSRVYLFHGQKSVSDGYLEMSKQLGYQGVIRPAAIGAFESGRWEESAEYFDERWRTSNSTVDALFAANSFQRQTEPRKAMLRKCLAYARWRDSYRNTAILQELEELGNVHWVVPFLKVDVFAVHGTRDANERYRLSLSNSQSTHDLSDALANAQIDLFNQLGARGLVSPGTFLRKGRDLAQLSAKVDLQRNRPDLALQKLTKIKSVFQQQAGLAEEMIPEFDRIGATHEADQLFEIIAKDYTKLLKKYPSSSLFRNDYAWTCACARRRTKFMRRHSRLAVASIPGNTSYLDTLAEVSFVLGDRDRAIDLALECIRLDPNRRHYQNQLKKFRTE